MKKKLYECEIRLTYYTLAEDEGEARGYAEDAARDALYPEDVSVRHVVEPVLVPQGGWNRSSQVYHTGELSLLTLGDVLDARDGWRKP